MLRSLKIVFCTTEKLINTSRVSFSDLDSISVELELAFLISSWLMLPLELCFVSIALRADEVGKDSQDSHVLLQVLSAISTVQTLMV
jgi:hypothetical protein